MTGKVLSFQIEKWHIFLGEIIAKSKTIFPQKIEAFNRIKRTGQHGTTRDILLNPALSRPVPNEIIMSRPDQIVSW